jgi:cell division protein FtsB
MASLPIQPRLARENAAHVLALVLLLVMGGFAIAGPSGIIAWSENERLLEQREDQIVDLRRERDNLRNRVDLLDPRNADPDLAGELLRRNLNVAHPDEMVILLK